MRKQHSFSQAADDRPAPARAQLAVLLGVLLLAAYLRFYHLGFQSLWHDELFSWYASRFESLREVVGFGASDDVHPPGYVVLMHFAQRLLGDSEAALRLPSALAGIASVAWIYRLGASWLSNREGLVAAALTAVAWFAVYYSQEARAYSLLFLGSIALVERLLALTRAPSVPDRAQAWLAFQVSLIAVLLSYLHYFGLLFTALSLLLWGVWVSRMRAARVLWLVVCCVSGAAYLPWLPHLMAQVRRGPIWIPAPTTSGTWQIYDTMTNGHLVLVLLIWLAGAASAWLRTPERNWRRACSSPLGVLLLWATLPMLAAAVIGRFLLPVSTDRNLIILLPALVLLTSAALVRVDRWFDGQPLASASAFGLLLGDLLIHRHYYVRPSKPQYREVAQRIVADSRGAPPFVISGAWHPSYFDYYFSHSGSPIRVSASATDPGQVQSVVDSLTPLNLWVAAPQLRPPRTRGGLELAGYERLGVWQYLGWDLYHFARQSRPGPSESR